MSERVQINHGDCREVIRTVADCSVDSCVTDPPYSLVSIQKRFGKAGRSPAKSDGATGVYRRASSGFMGQTWDTGETAFDPDFWAEVLRVFKPGAHLLAFSGTRTYHRMACAIEDAGFEIRDQVGWLYGSGFPKSHNVGKELPNWQGWGTALKPAWEPICLARKPLIGTVAANVMAHGTGALNIDGCRVEGPMDGLWGASNKTTNPDRMFNGSADKAEYTTEAHPAGRWPANVIHDGSIEVERAFPDSDGQKRDVTGAEQSKSTKNCYGNFDRNGSGMKARADIGSAARFFYSAKADAEDRLGSKHPTVKPVDLIAYLARLVTPPGGLILDPFAGTGTLGAAAMREGFRAILIEREAQFIADIRRRVAHASGMDTPLFGSVA